MAGAVRAACLADIPRIFDIRAAVRENRLADPSRVTHADAVWFVEAGALFVWEEAGQIGGFSAGDPRDGSIWALFVDPPWEGQGAGAGPACGRLCCPQSQRIRYGATVHRSRYTGGTVLSAQWLDSRLRSTDAENAHSRGSCNSSAQLKRR